jgi:rhodanese-related sulfurtransferase
MSDSTRRGRLRSLSVGVGAFALILVGTLSVVVFRTPLGILGRAFRGPRTTMQNSGATPGPARPVDTTLLPRDAPPQTGSTGADDSPIRVDTAERLDFSFPSPATHWARIAVDDIRLLHKYGELILDVRDSAAFLEGHIAGARFFPASDPDLSKRANTLVRQNPNLYVPVVLYGQEATAPVGVAELLFGAGFRNVLVSRQGFVALRAGGLPVRRGPELLNRDSIRRPSIPESSAAETLEASSRGPLQSVGGPAPESESSAVGQAPRPGPSRRNRRQTDGQRAGATKRADNP